MFIFFFFQAEDGIRDYKVTGVQTCALPICQEPEHAAVGVAQEQLSGLGHAQSRARLACLAHARCGQSARLLRLYEQAPLDQQQVELGGIPDRKSTRLNSSHLVISYAVFCLKKKKYNTLTLTQCQYN